LMLAAGRKSGISQDSLGCGRREISPLFCLFALTVLEEIDSDLIAIDPSQFAATKGETG
jgi:hypothetical protein